MDAAITRHMNAEHNKEMTHKIKECVTRIKQYDRNYGIPHGNFTSIEIRSNGVYLVNHHEEMKLDKIQNVGG